MNEETYEALNIILGACTANKAFTIDPELNKALQKVEAWVLEVAKEYDN